MANPNVLKYIKRDKEDLIDTGLIDPDLMQKMQDFFCAANGVYLSCIGKREGVITKAFGEKKELEYIHSLVGMDEFMSLLRKVEDSGVESLIEEPLDVDFIKMCGVKIKVEDTTQIIWVVVGILKENLPADMVLPHGIHTTTEEHYYRSVEFLEVLTKQLLAAKMSELIAQEAMLKSEQTKDLIEQQLIRSESMTEIVKFLESENGFSRIVDDSLEETCATLGITGGCLFRENTDGKTIDMICEYVPEGVKSHLSEFRNIPKSEVPFFTGNPYLISSDSMKPQQFIDFFEKYDMTAAIYQPIEVNDKVLMYLCFFESEKERIWSVADIKYLNDVKRIIQSILVKRISKNSLASSYTSLEAILENVGCGIYVVDQQLRKILYTNRKISELYSNTIAAGKIEELMLSEWGLGKTHSYEELYSAVEDRWLDVHKTQIDWVDGRTVSLCTVYDVTDKKKYQKKIESQANNDFLTGLYNRMRCEQDLERYIRRTEMAGTEGALIYIDLDDFKHINDGLGHQCGDILLKSISHSLLRVEGVNEKCYRMGGDEFMIIILDSNRDKLEKITSEIRNVFTNPWFLKGEDYYCTCSIGVAVFPTDGKTVEDVIRKADMALFSAKRRGKNCVEFYDTEDEERNLKRLDLEKNMRSATMNECEEFEVYYQPIMDLKKGGEKCCGAEALVRWNSNALGFIEPNDFITLAEYLGLIEPIGEHVLLNAAKRCKYWNDMGHPDYKVNVNISVIQLLQNDFVKKVRAVLSETRINPNNLRLEVTESLAINDMDRMKKIISEIKATGVGVVLDDFGTGYSSLSRIRELPVDVIKIDKCFIEHLAQDDYSDAFVKMMAELARTLGVKICAEGVETELQYKALKEMNVRLLQGYYFGKPMKVEEFEAKYL